MKALIVCFFALATLSLQAQSIATSNLGAAGQELNSSAGTIHFNIGEIAIDRSTQIKEGLIQYVGISTLTENKFEVEGLEVFPNPTHGPLTIRHQDVSIEEWKISDHSGRIIHAFATEGLSFDVNLGALPAGQYYLIPFSEARPLTAIAIQIIH